MSLNDKFRIIENHIQIDDKKKLYDRVENYFENYLNSDIRILIPDYINQIIWFEGINLENFTVNIDSHIKNYLISRRNNMRSLIKKDNFDILGLNKFIKNFISKLEYLNSIIKFKEYLVNGPIDYNGHKVNFHNLLNNIINGSRSLINDANVVLSEINYVSQFGNVYDNFIKNFYNNNNELPYMPISILYYIDTLQMSGPNNSALLPNGINTNESKYINYTNFILNNESNNKEQDINNYLWLKEQVKIYNNSALSTNTLDSKKLNQFLSNNKNLIFKIRVFFTEWVIVF